MGGKEVSTERQSDMLLGYMLAMKDWVLPKSDDTGIVLSGTCRTFDTIAGTTIGESLSDIMNEKNHKAYIMIAQMYMFMQHAKKLDFDGENGV
jgi:hypothetical protein